MVDHVFCRSSREQLYMLECLVHELKIFLDNVTTTDNAIYVSLKFANLPVFIINQKDFSALKDNVKLDTSNCHSRTIPFQVGKSCLFSSHPDKLRSWIQEEPVKISVHNVLKAKYNEEGELEQLSNQDEFIAGADIFLANCNNDFAVENFATDHFSEPKTLKTLHHLRDSEDRPFGSIKILIRLSCFGNLLVTKFSQPESGFIFKTGHSLNEFQCSKVQTEEETLSEIDIQSESSSVNSSNILGLSLICEDLAATDGGPKVNVPAEVLKEQPAKSSDHNRLKQDNIAAVANLPKPCLSDTNCPCMTIASQDCVRSSSCCETKINGAKDYSRTKRMRGGACQVNDDLNNNHVCCGCNKVIKDDQDTKNTACFQKSIEEAQEILNSLGNRSGFAGLGILGPTESPYFRRKQDQQYNDLMKSWREDASQKQNYASDNAHSKPKKNNKSNNNNNDEDYAMPVVEKAAEKQQYFRRSAENLENVIDDRGISTMYHQKESHFEKTSSKHTTKSHKKGKRKRNKFGRRKKKFQMKSMNSTVTCQSTVLKPLFKPSKDIMKHAFAMREYNPGIYYGHRNCLDLNMRIPANMGWLWNTCDNPGISKPRYGWKPGAISKHVYHLLMKAKSEAGVLVSDKTPSSSSLQNKSSHKGKTKSLHTMQSQSKLSFGKDKGKGSCNESELPPLVQIQRKDGDYYVTINPVRQSDPNAKPLQLKISKNEEDDNASNSTAPDFNLACSAPAQQQALQSKLETKDMDTQVKQQEILDSIRAIIGKAHPKSKPKKGAKPKKK